MKIKLKNENLKFLDNKNENLNLNLIYRSELWLYFFVAINYGYIFY